MAGRRTLDSLVALSLSWAAGLAAQTAPNPSASQAAQEETCTVSGVGSRKDDSAPLKNATVQLENSENREHIIATKTATDGRFELHNIPAGQYRLKVNRNGYVEAELGQKRPGDPGATYTLRPGQRMTDLHFELARAAVIAGRILDEDGEPLAHALVNAMRQVYKDGRHQLEAVATEQSNDRGEFRLFGLKPGRYFVSVLPEFWTHVIGDPEFSNVGKLGGERGYAKVYYPGVSDPTKASSIVIREGEEISSIDILMKEATVYRIHGKVVNLISRHGASDTNLEVFGRGQDVSWNFIRFTRDVKKDGSFEIPEMFPGEYTIVAYFFDEGKIYSAQEDVDVENGDINGLIVTIGPGVDLPGQIVWEGKPSLEGDQVTVAVSDSLQAGEIWSGRAKVDADGQFTLKDVPPFTFRIQVGGISKDCYVKEIRQGESVSSEETFRVARGNATSLSITVSSRGARLEGSVTNDDNLPVAGVWVVAVPEESKRKLQHLYKSFTTDQYGRFTLRGMAPGRYALFAWGGIEENAWEDPEFLKPFEEKGVTVEVKDGSAQALDLQLIELKDRKAN